MTSLPGPAEPLDISFTADPLPLLTGAFARYGDAFKVHAEGIDNAICVFNHPDHVRRVLVDNHVNYTKGIGIERVRILLGNGIMASEGEFWRRQRKMIQPAFHRDTVAGLSAEIRQANRRLRDRWAAAAKREEPINLTAELSGVTLRIVLKAIFGADFEAIDAMPGGNPFMLLAEDTGRNLQFAYRFRALSKLVLDHIRKRRAGPAGNDLLGHLVSTRDRHSGESMTDRQLVDETLTMVVAGHETTASALNWFWYLLSRHVKAEDRIHQEIDDCPSDLEDADLLARLPYTRQVIEETLRLYPPGWLLTRRAIGADVVGGHAIEPGTDVFISPYLIHRHPGFWDEPERFRPERFDAAVKTGRNRFCYLPFALGPRACIGEHFAMVEMIIHAAVIASALRLRYIGTEDVELECQVNLRPRQPIHMQPEIRH